MTLDYDDLEDLAAIADRLHTATKVYGAGGMPLDALLHGAALSLLTALAGEDGEYLTHRLSPHEEPHLNVLDATSQPAAFEHFAGALEDLASEYATMAEPPHLVIGWFYLAACRAIAEWFELRPLATDDDGRIVEVGGDIAPLLTVELQERLVSSR